MAKWTIHPVVFGDLTGTKEMVTTGPDAGMPVTLPYLGFYLTDDRYKVLCDTGINGKYIVDGKAWAGLPARGGEDFVSRALSDVGVTPDEID